MFPEIKQYTFWSLINCTSLAFFAVSVSLTVVQLTSTRCIRLCYLVPLENPFDDSSSCWNSKDLSLRTHKSSRLGIIYTSQQCADCVLHYYNNSEEDIKFKLNIEYTLHNKPFNYKTLKCCHLSSKPPPYRRSNFHLPGGDFQSVAHLNKINVCSLKWANGIQISAQSD